MTIYVYEPVTMIHFVRTDMWRMFATEAKYHIRFNPRRLREIRGRVL